MTTAWTKFLLQPAYNLRLPPREAPIGGRDAAEDLAARPLPSYAAYA